MEWFRKIKPGRDRWAQAGLAPRQPFAAVGDLHGCADLLEELLTHFPLSHDMPLIFLGDYIDRGENSADVLRILQALCDSFPETVCLKGNHEDMLLNFLIDPAKAGPRWLRSGGLQTLQSYGLSPEVDIFTPREWLALRDEFAAALGEQTLYWLRNLPTMWRSGNLALSHAGANPAVPLSMQRERDLVWGHRDFLLRARSDDMWILFGHLIVSEPTVSAGRIAIDTGAFATGRLTLARVVPGAVSFETIESAVA